MNASQLPIDRHIPDIKTGLLDHNTLILQAPPGAGKTTRVPPAMLNEPWLDGKMILLLEPRRLAAISCARHMARLMGEPVGQTVGYQIRLEVKKSRKTRILVVTEGIFTRMIQGDPGLQDIGLVIFDEFHERSIHSDLGLALVTESQGVFRPDLRVLVMSATIDTERLSQLLDHAPVVQSRGRLFPVKTVYCPDTATTANRNRPAIEQRCADTVTRALKETGKDILVFLPGVAEIKRLESLLKKMAINDLMILTLHGNLPAQAQLQVFNPAPAGKRKIIIATAIAETSITIDGIGVVIDSGLMRQPFFSPQTGMSRLETLTVSKASADQRRGRAGRTAEGVCYRLWSEYDQSLLKSFSKPEIRVTDLAGVVLELAAWGISDPSELKWLDSPDTVSIANARDLLTLLGALDGAGKITPHGKQMAGFGLHPRLSHMVLKAREKGCGFTGCRLAALLMERDILVREQADVDPDIGMRLAVMDAWAGFESKRNRFFKLNKGILKRVLKSEEKMAKDAGISMDRVDESAAGRVLAFAYPDRIAKRRDNRQQTYLMASGKGCRFHMDTTMAGNEYIVAFHLDGNPANAKIHMAAAYDRQTLETDFCGRIKKTQTLAWDTTAKEVRAKELTTFERIILDQNMVDIGDREKACHILVDEIKKAGLDILPWNKKLTSMRQRGQFLKNTGFYPDLPDLSDTVLSASVHNWLGPFLDGIYAFKELDTVDMEAAFSMVLSWQQVQTIEKEAPSHLVVPSGSKIGLIYADRTGILTSPVLKVRLQEMFGLEKTPKVASNRVEVTVHLLSPAGRAVQITKDLKNFWENTYTEVKKDLMGRYPKHYWPDDPYKAVPTNRVKPKK